MSIYWRLSVMALYCASLLSCFSINFGLKVTIFICPALFAIFKFALALSFLSGAHSVNFLICLMHFGFLSFGNISNASVASLNAVRKFLFFPCLIYSGVNFYFCLIGNASSLAGLKFGSGAASMNDDGLSLVTLYPLVTPLFGLYTGECVPLRIY